MNLSDATTRIGAKVVYRPYRNASPEEGVITSTNHTYVFVRYGADVHSKATLPGYLEFIGGAGDE